MSLFTRPPETPDTSSQQLRVMVVDDSAAVRGAITRILESDPEIKVVSSATNGKAAIEALSRSPVDVVVLDIEMPIMDGMTALPQIMAAHPDLKVIMASTLTLKNAEISMKALSLGAADYVPKPSNLYESTSSRDFRHELISTIKAHANARRRKLMMPQPGKGPIGSSAQLSSKLYPGQEVKLRPFSKVVPEVIGIGSSTGGPQALLTVLKGIKGMWWQPILITQHMPPKFTTVLAEHISRESGLPSREAVDGETVQQVHIYVAPGDFHMLIVKEGGRHIFRLNQDAPENFCRPSVDPMFRSLAAAYGPRVLGVVLTGMGSDGAKGAGDIVNAGGNVVAQDEPSSVVWGMPGATAIAGHCSELASLENMQKLIKRIAAP
ncbi:MAG: chemotaxis response regulator protein-glutamate methylesterase [Holosporales bacterium]